MDSLRFNKNGKFTIMQVADIQDTQHTSSDTLHFLKAALDQVRPDLVVFTGDQLKGYGLSFKGGEVKKKVQQAIQHILAPLAIRNIPFAVTFGNHDAQNGCSKKEQLAMYQAYPNCVTQEADSTLPGCGNDCLKIKRHDSENPAFAIYVVDSLDYAPDGSYACVSREQIRWYEETARSLQDQNQGVPVPSLLFQHIPVPEIYDLMVKTNKRARGAILGNKSHRDYYLLDPAIADQNNFMKENAATPLTNNGQFQSWLRTGGLLGAYFGHDHNNCFVGKVNGIDLGYTPGCGFHVYGPGFKRAVRVFEIDEADPQAYTTYPLFYKDVCGRRVHNPAKFLLYTYAPSSVETAIPMVGKALLGAGAAAVAGAVLAKRLRK